VPRACAEKLRNMYACRAESGVNPEALAHVVKELRRESAALQQAERESEGIRAMGL